MIFNSSVKVRFKGNIQETDQKGWITTINRCIQDIDIPKTALRFQKKHKKRSKTLSRCLDNIKMTEKIVELSCKYPFTLKKTINELVKDIKGDSSDLADHSREDYE